MSLRQSLDIHLALLGVAHSLNHSLFLISPPLLGLIMNSLGVSKAEIGLVMTIASLIYGVGAIVGGPLGDRIGEAKIIIICLVFSGLSTFVMIAVTVVGTIYVYALALILMAAWASLYHPVANSLISKAFKNRVSVAMGMHGVVGTVGIVLTPTISWLIGAAFGWPWAFICFGVPSMIVALLIAKFYGEDKHTNEKKGSISEALKIPDLKSLLIFNVAIGFFMKGIDLFSPIYLGNNKGIGSMWASIALSLMLTAGVFGQLLGGIVADKYGSKRVLIVAMAGICISLVSLLFFPIPLIGIAIFVLVYGLFFNAHQPALTAITGLCSPEKQRGAVFGIFFFTSFGLGSFSQVISGYIGDLYGLDWAFYLLTFFAVIALLLSLRIPDKRPTVEQSAALSRAIYSENRRGT